MGGRYRLVRPVARGGMAEVWEGRDETLDRAVAVKILHGHLAGDPQFLHRFRREAVAVGRLNHPNVVAVYDTGVDPGAGGPPRAYIVMELVRGESLRTLAARGLTLEQAVDVAAQAAEGLGYAHQHGLVHRDVKPANILVQPDGRVKVADFGIAKAAHADEAADEHDLTRSGAVLGTAKYLSPEQVEGRGADARSDIYALGVVLYELVCGRPPYVGKGDLATALLHVQGGAPRPRQVRPGVPRPLEDVILRAMAREPAQRFPTAFELARTLRAIDLAPDDAAPLTTRLPVDRTPPRGTTATIPRAATTVLPAPARRRSLAAPLAALAVAGAVLGAGAGVLAADRFGPDTSWQALSVVDVQSYDPRGDGQENEAATSLAVDGDPTTAWFTRDGRDDVGLVFELERARALHDLVVRSPDRGWSAAAFVADQPGNDLSDWGAPEDEVAGAGGRVELRLRGKSGRFVLLLLTDLGAGRRVRITEAQVRA